MGGGRPTGPLNNWKPPQGPWQRPKKDEDMRLAMCEALMAVASERPSKAQHAQELEFSMYEAAPTKEQYLQAATASYNELMQLLKHHIPRLAGRTRGPGVKYPKAPLPGSTTALNLKKAQQAAAAAASAAAAAAAAAEQQEDAGSAAAAAGGAADQQ